MSYNPTTGIITYPVVLDRNRGDIQRALGVASESLATLCTHRNVNVWSKYKPVRFNQLDTTKNMNSGAPWLDSNKAWNSLAQWWRLKELDGNTDLTYHCGFFIPRMQISELVDGELDVWEYLRPRGRGTENGQAYYEPFRKIDFNQYYHKAVCPFRVILPERATLPNLTDSKIRISSTLDQGNPLNLSVNDIFGLNSGNAYIGVAAIRDGNLEWRTLQVGTAMFTLQGCSLAADPGTVRLVAFATTEYNTNWTSISEHETFYVYSLEAPNIDFFVSGNCEIRNALVDEYIIKASGFQPLDAVVMKTVGTTESNGWLTAPTKWTTRKLSNSYVLSNIHVTAYVVDAEGNETAASSYDFTPYELSASPTYVEYDPSYIPPPSGKTGEYTLQCDSYRRNLDLPTLDPSENYYRIYYDFVYSKE